MSDEERLMEMNKVLEQGLKEIIQVRNQFIKPGSMNRAVAKGVRLALDIIAKKALETISASEKIEGLTE